MLRNGGSGLAFEIDRSSIVPVYRQIEEWLREQILTGAWPEGTRLPPERSLAAALLVNRSTVVHAYRDLVLAGLIEQRVGSGSRVAPLTRGKTERGPAVPWWVTLPPWRVGEFPPCWANSRRSNAASVSRSCRECTGVHDAARGAKSGPCIYLSSFSKTIAPSLRLGWLCAPRTIYERLLLREQSYDMASSMYVQASVCDYMRTAYDAHLPRLRAELEARRAIALDAHWPETMRVMRNGGGYYIWATAPREQRARVLLDAAERRGASFLFGEAFYAQTGGDHHFRLAITPVSRAALTEGIRRIGQAIAR